MLTVFFDINISLPITDPTWIFFLVLTIILFAPMILERLHIPHIIGMILAGVAIGEYGFNILERDSSFELFGEVGLYYIMFLAGLEMNMEDFKKNKSKGIIFGLLSFAIRFGIGMWSCLKLLNFGLTTSILMGCMYASHTLISYPIISRYGLSRLRSVNITIGGTIIVDTLALIGLAIISGMYKGDTSSMFWVIMGVKVVLLTAFIIFVFPIIARQFFLNYSDNIMQFVFVLAMVFLGAGLMQFVGMEGILGAFLTGLVLNRLIPHVSPLMSRLEFVGNAIFIPYFLIGVGMMIDINALFTGGQTLKVAMIMTTVAIGSKWIGALVTQKIFGMTGNERRMVFGLSSASAAATLAAVLVGHQIIMENGERLINDDVLNGTVVMILFTCIVSSLATERSARKFALEEKLQFSSNKGDNEEVPEQILIPVANPDTIDNLINLALMIRDRKLKRPLIALNIITDNKNIQERKQQGERNLEKAAKIAASADVKVTPVSRYDLNVASGIIHSAEEYNATNLVIGLHHKAKIIDSFFGNLTEGILKGTCKEVMIARYLVPSTSINKIHVAVPPQAEYETGFVKWIDHLSRMSSQLGCQIVYYAEVGTLKYLKEVVAQFSACSLAAFEEMTFWNDFYRIKERMQQTHLAVIVCARRSSISYDTSFERIPSLLSKFFQDNNMVVLYPEQLHQEELHRSFSDPLRHNEYQHYDKAREWVTDLFKPDDNIANKK